MLNVLVVEDESIIANDIAATLKRLGHGVSGIVASGEEALQRVEASTPDLVLMDIKLDGKMDGIETAQHLHERFKTPVIYLTAHADDKILQRAKYTEPFGYIVKPFKDQTIFTAIEMAFHKSQKQRELRDSEARFRKIADAAPVMIWMTGPDHVATYFSKAWQEFTNGNLAHELDRRTSASVHPDDRRPVEDVYENSFKALSPFRIEYRLRRHDGVYRWVEDRGVPLFSQRDEFEGFIGGCTDIHDQKLAQENLAQLVAERTEEVTSAQEKLRQSEKLEVIGQLAGGVAHDFNNLIVGILGMAEDLKERWGEDRAGIEDLMEIIKAGERAKGLTRQLLAIGRKQTLQPEVLNINLVLLELKTMLERLLGKDIQVELLLGGIPAITIDRSNLEQVVLNLAINARDAMPKGGKFVLRTLLSKISAASVARKNDVPPGHYVTLEATDTGHGMTRETLSHIFEPFFTTKKKNEGSGLGLAMVYGIVKQNGGDIRVDSSPGNGTCFKTYFPVSRDLLGWSSGISSLPNA